ncbi:CXXC zinc finger domain-containing protein [Ditylenchus destructor]|nr:CXXC zinc finger domain-containing protein [Ditylenchus destructor]
MDPGLPNGQGRGTLPSTGTNLTGLTPNGFTPAAAHILCGQPGAGGLSSFGPPPPSALMSAFAAAQQQQQFAAIGTNGAPFPYSSMYGRPLPLNGAGPFFATPHQLSQQSSCSSTSPNSSSANSTATSSSSLSTTPTHQQSGNTTNSINRSQRCGVCRGCQCKPCGVCTYCQDSPQFGGPGVKKQSCIERRCLRVLENRLQRDAPTFKARVGCGHCDDCRAPDCQICLVCLDKRFFNNRYMCGALCAKKRCNNATTLELPSAASMNSVLNGEKNHLLKRSYETAVANGEHLMMAKRRGMMETGPMQMQQKIPPSAPSHYFSPASDPVIQQCQTSGKSPMQSPSNCANSVVQSKMLNGPIEGSGAPNGNNPNGQALQQDSESSKGITNDTKQQRMTPENQNSPSIANYGSKLPASTNNDCNRPHSNPTEIGSDGSSGHTSNNTTTKSEFTVTNISSAQVIHTTSGQPQLLVSAGPGGIPTYNTLPPQVHHIQPPFQIAHQVPFFTGPPQPPSFQQPDIVQYSTPGQAIHFPTPYQQYQQRFLSSNFPKYEYYDDDHSHTGAGQFHANGNGTLLYDSVHSDPFVPPSYSELKNGVVLQPL